MKRRISARDAAFERKILEDLTEIGRRPGVKDTVAFTFKPGPQHKSLAWFGDSGPQPMVSTIHEDSKLGNIVVQGYARVLTEEEKRLVEARFSGWGVTWSSPPSEI